MAESRTVERSEWLQWKPPHHPNPRDSIGGGVSSLPAPGVHWIIPSLGWTAPLGLDRRGRDVALSDEAGKREPHHGSETKIQCGLQAAGGGGDAGRRGAPRCAPAPFWSARFR